MAKPRSAVLVVVTSTAAVRTPKTAQAEKSRTVGNELFRILKDYNIVMLQCRFGGLIVNISTFSRCVLCVRCTVLCCFVQNNVYMLFRAAATD